MHAALRPLVTRLLSGDLLYLLYILRIRLAGVDFSAEDISRYGVSAAHGHAHMRSGGPDLARVLDQVLIPPQSRVLDLGSGKGAACFTLADYPFDEVVGVELCADLVQIAESNAARLGASVRFVCGDAATFTDLDRFTHLYLFNPFPCAVLAQVWRNLYVSLERCPRHMTVIYKYPGSDPLDLDPSRFTRRVVRLPHSHPFYVYDHHCTRGCGYV